MKALSNMHSKYVYSNASQLGEQCNDSWSLKVFFSSLLNFAWLSNWTALTTAQSLTVAAHHRQQITTKIICNICALWANEKSSLKFLQILATKLLDPNVGRGKWLSVFFFCILFKYSCLSPSQINKQIDGEELSWYSILKASFNSRYFPTSLSLNKV